MVSVLYTDRKKSSNRIDLDVHVVKISNMQSVDSLLSDVLNPNKIGLTLYTSLRGKATRLIKYTYINIDLNRTTTQTFFQISKLFSLNLGFSLRSTSRVETSTSR